MAVHYSFGFLITREMRVCGDCMRDRLLIRAISLGAVHDVCDHYLNVVVYIVAKAVDGLRCFPLCMFFWCNLMTQTLPCRSTQTVRYLFRQR